ncbi:MarR family winged helix-turn-helix transcriptional regulator [Acidovorax sp.]|uniref:MarR family winged helix-turn-helix transcriptional regulator n=1 Tax=Acidovorax sp. TaxID=1872122 RepID=UPI0040378B9B
MKTDKNGPVPAGADTKVPPPRAAARPADVEGAKATVNRYLAAYIMGVANRLANGASNYYRSQFSLGMSEWRAMMAIAPGEEQIVREVAEMADLDYAAASKSVRVLQERGLVSIEQTSRRGRAAVVRITPEGAVVRERMREAAQVRQERLLAGFSDDEVDMLWTLLQRVEAQVPAMNAD